MPELSPFSQNLSMTRILCGSFEKLKMLPQPEKRVVITSSATALHIALESPPAISSIPLPSLRFLNP
jgi:hypothetical protein